jgi:hypothetical protein
MAFNAPMWLPAAGRRLRAQLALWQCGYPVEAAAAAAEG